MRKMTLFLLLISSLHLYAQWNDNFNDGDFTQNPLWSGNPESFIINSSQQLQLNTTTAGTAYLSTPKVLAKGSTWHFWVKLGFSASSASFARIYISADKATVGSAQSAYYLLLGGTAKRISLFKKSSTATSEIIAGADNELNTATSAEIKLELSHQGIWRLFAKFPTDKDFVSKGEFTDTSLLTGDFMGIYCAYAASYSKAFYFDDFSIISTAEEDTIPPKIINVHTDNKTTISVQFSEAISLLNAKFYVNGIGNSTSEILTDDKKTVVLSFASPFSEGLPYLLNINGVRDTLGNEMSIQNSSFTYWSILTNAKAGDVVISEIMANPVGAAGLPEAEYVELHNNSASRVNLEGWHFYYGDKGYSIPAYWLLPDSFVVVANPTTIAKMASLIPKIGVESFPILANSGKLLYLQSPQNELISFAEYSDKWYGDDFKAKGGFSLECIDLTNIGGNASNWKATTDKRGGTPGAQNSVKGSNPDIQIPELLKSSLISSDSILLSFSEVVSKSDLSAIENYHLLPNEFSIKKTIVSSPIPNSVIIVLNKSLASGDQLTVELQNVHSFSGVVIPKPVIIRLALSEMATAQDVIINEILFNPKANGADYVEIYNRSNRIIDLSKLYLTAKKTDGSLQTGIRLADVSTPFFPHEYLAFTTDKTSVVNEFPSCDPSVIVQLSSMPSMPDTEGNIQLVNASAEIIDGFVYSEKMHHPMIKNAEGVALERLSSERPSSDANNWQSASSDSGWGTPGLKNSQQIVENNDAKDFWLESETITPDNNGQDDVLRIHYRLDESGYSAIVRIYTPSGKLIANIANNQILGSEGVLTWSATDLSGKMVNPGIYLLYIQYYKTNKSPYVKKMPVVVGN